MKTERFDEEFRRKLLGLPAEVDPGEVERIQGFVRANKPTLPHVGWGKLLLYSGSSLLLIGSLSYNLIQTYRNTHLQASIDSLTHRPVERIASSERIRHDTVYITRSGNTAESLSLRPIEGETTRQKPLEPTGFKQPTENQRSSSVAMERSTLPKTDLEEMSNQSESGSPPLAARHTESATTNTPTETDQLRGESKPSESLRTEILPKSRPTGAELVEGNSSRINLSPTTRPNGLRVTARQKTGAGNKQSTFVDEKNSQLATNYTRTQNRRATPNSPPHEITSTTTENAKLNASVFESNRQTTKPVEPLVSRQRATTNQLALISPSHSLVVPKSELAGKAPRQSWNLTMPRLAVPNAQYRIGAGFMAGHDQVGGGVLSEIQLNSHWSVQAGLQLGYNQGFHYRDEQDFDDHEKEDFRQTYASQVPSSSDIEDISQLSLLLQLPLQVAYHFPIGKQCSLRLGVGTDLDLALRSVVKYSYRENSRSAEHGLSLLEEPVTVFNNLTLSTSLERSWKKWLFRAGPFISPQLRSVGYRSDDLLWGANLQILYRLGK